MDFVHRWIVMLAALAMYPMAAWANLLITEFMADNQQSRADGFGNYSDWIEIHNPTPVSVNLAGWQLRDSTRSWTFPPYDLTSGGYVIVFASGRDVTNALDPKGYLHASFQLAASGETLALVNPAGETVFAYPTPVPPQREDVSYGLLTERLSLVDYDTDAKLLVPTGPVDDAWRGGGFFDDSAWLSGKAGAGFNLDPGPVLGGVGATPAYRVAAGTAGTQAYGGALGMDFVVIEPVQITALGVFDDGANGLRTTLTAQLWQRNDHGTPANFADDTAGALLTTLTFDSASPGTLEGGSRFKPLSTPLTLQPGSYTMVAFGYNDQEHNGNAGTGSDPEAWTTETANGALEFVGASRYGDAGKFPLTVDGGPADRYAAGTFKFVRAADSALRTDLSPFMPGHNASLLLRIPFTLANPEKFSSCLLRIGYDDGFVAWINGMEVARRNAPQDLRFDSHAASPGNAIESIPVGVPDGLLKNGTNFLAIQGLNASIEDRDFIIAPELTAVRVDIEASRYFRHPTPGEPNDADSIVGFVAEPVFSVPRGFYEAPFQVELGCETPGATIHYTLDCSTPDTNQGLLYQSPITISNTTVLRAVAFNNGLEPSSVTTHTYLFLKNVAVQNNTPPGYPRSWGVTADYGMVTNLALYARAAGNLAFTPEQARAAIVASLQSLPSLCINTSISNLFDPAKGLYLNPAGRGEDWERPVSAELLLPDGSPGFQINAGLQTMGFTSRSLSTSPKLNLRLLFAQRFGPGSLHYPFFGANAASRFNSIALRSNTRDTWLAEYSGLGTALYIADQWAKETTLDMGQPGPHGRFVHLYLNGLYWGVYNPTERPDAAFVASYLGGEREDYDVVKFCCPDLIVDGDMLDWNELLAACAAGLSSNAAYQRIQGNDPDGRRNPALKRLVDVDNLIDFIIAGQYHASVDWPGNYYVGRYALDPVSEGFKFFPWDNDLAFSGANVNANKVQTDPGSSWWITSPGALDIALRQNADYRIRFADHVYRHYFHQGALTTAAIARWQRIAALIEPALYAESARWGDYRGTLHTVQDHWRTMNNRMVQQFFPARANVVLGQLRSQNLFPRLNAPEFNQEGGSIPDGFVIRFTASAPAYFTLDGSDPRLPGGGVSPQAIKAAGTNATDQTFILPHSALLRARAYDGTNWSALHQAQFVLGRLPGPGELAITELNYHPANPTPMEQAAGFQDASDFEFIELANFSTNALILDGLQFTAGIALDQSHGPVRSLQPDECALFVANLEAFLFRYGGAFSNRIAGVFTPDKRLANHGERLTLCNASNAPILDFSYSDVAPWPAGADGAGSTLVLMDPANPSQPGAWRSSCLPGGTPGTITSLREEWSRTYFTPAELTIPDISGAQADPDKDGLLNLEEFVLGSNPRQPDHDVTLLSARLATLSIDGASNAYLVLSFRRPTDAGVQAILDVSTDLISWQPGLNDLAPLNIIPDAANSWQTVSSRTILPVAQYAATQRFWRLRIAVQP